MQPRSQSQEGKSRSFTPNPTAGLPIKDFTTQRTGQEWKTRDKLLLLCLEKDNAQTSKLALLLQEEWKGQRPNLETSAILKEFEFTRVPLLLEPTDRGSC